MYHFFLQFNRKNQVTNVPSAIGQKDLDHSPKLKQSGIQQKKWN